MACSSLERTLVYPTDQLTITQYEIVWKETSDSSLIITDRRLQVSHTTSTAFLPCTYHQLKTHFFTALTFEPPAFTCKDTNQIIVADNYQLPGETAFLTHHLNNGILA